jgi:hypothetical protein
MFSSLLAAAYRREGLASRRIIGSIASRVACTKSQSDPFAIEADIKGRPPAERLAARRAKATPILSELRAFLDATMEKISGKSSLAGAFRYAASRWTALTRYVGDGRLEMSNNAAERAMRPLALGTKTICSPALMKAAAAPLSYTRSSRPLA